MARIRTIKPEFFTSLTVAALTPLARLTFIGLWTHADDEGRCVDEPRLIKAAIWPLDDRTAADVDEDLNALAEAKLIRRYEVAGRRYITVTGWHEHQSINRPGRSKFPAPHEGSPVTLVTQHDGSPTPHGALTDNSHQERNREQGTGNREEEPSSAAAPPDDEPVRPDVDALCEHLADRIEANGSKRPTVTRRWRDAARLMLDADGRTQQQVRDAIDWCQGDTFWRGNVMSMPKLREKYDQLRLAAAARQATARAPTKAEGSNYLNDIRNGTYGPYEEAS